LLELLGIREKPVFLPGGFLVPCVSANSLSFNCRKKQIEYSLAGLDYPANRFPPESGRIGTETDLETIDDIGGNSEPAKIRVRCFVNISASGFEFDVEIFAKINGKR
jgi:hypothetical protein